MMATCDIRQDEITVAEFPTRSADERGTRSRFVLWMDGIGGFLLCLGPRTVLGGPGDEADVSLMASLSRRHMTLVRSGESYLIEPHAPTRLEGRLLEGPTPVRHGDLLEPGDPLRLRFRQPSPLSATAVLEPLAGSLPLAPRRSGPKLAAPALDGVVLLDGVCLIGPQSDRHIITGETDEALVLFRRDGAFFCKAPSEVQIDGHPAPTWGPIPPGAIVTTAEVRFHIEEDR